jgi:hypothetical protein
MGPVWERNRCTQLLLELLERLYEELRLFPDCQKHPADSN